MPVIGFLGGSSLAERRPMLAGFRQALVEAGYVQGQSVAIEFLWAEGQYDRLPALAAELVRRQVAVLVAGDAPSALAAKGATTTIPIVFSTGTDPVQVGLVTSLSRQGGNLTGFNLIAGPLQAKRLGLLHELVPAAKIIAVLINPNNAPNTTRQPCKTRRARSGCKSSSCGQPLKAISRQCSRPLVERGPAASSSTAISFLPAGAIKLWRSRRAMRFPSCRSGANSHSPAASSATAPASRPPIVKSAFTPPRFSTAPSPATCR